MLVKAFSFMPAIMIGTALCLILAFCIKNKNTKKILFIIGASVAIIYVYFIMGIVTPYTFISSIFDGVEGYLWIFAIIISVWLLISLYIRLKNIIIFNSNKEKSVYIRDVDVDYSPAVCSYLMNNRIETKKDLTATLLNLCAKGIVKIEKQGNNINIIDLKNKEAQKLSEDEKYAYEMLVSKVTSSKLITWKNKVEEEYEKYVFSKKNKKQLGMFIFGVYVAIFIGIFIFFAITGEYSIGGKLAAIIGKLLITCFLAAWETIIISGFIEMIKFVVGRNNGSEFQDTYTAKGAREFNKWRKFMAFIHDFSLIEERSHEDVTIWGKYLSYSIALGINKHCDKELYSKIQKEYSFDFNIFENIDEGDEK